MTKFEKLFKNRKNEALAVEFLNSRRGQWIIGQALHLAIEALENVEPPHREPSNIDDMKFLRYNLFSLYQQPCSIT